MYIKTLPQVYLRCKYVNRSFLNCEQKKINSLALVATIITLQQLHPATGWLNQWCCYGSCPCYLKSYSPNVQIYVDNILSGSVMREGKKSPSQVLIPWKYAFVHHFCNQEAIPWKKREVACMRLVFLLGFFWRLFFHIYSWNLLASQCLLSNLFRKCRYEAF